MDAMGSFAIFLDGISVYNCKSHRGSIIWLAANLVGQIPWQIAPGFYKDILDMDP